MTKNQILNMHSHRLRANFQQFVAAAHYTDPNSEVGDYLHNAIIHAFISLGKFYAKHTELFNKYESELLNAAITICKNACKNWSDEDTYSLTNIQLTNIQWELFKYYNYSIDENGYFKED